MKRTVHAVLLRDVRLLRLQDGSQHQHQYMPQLNIPASPAITMKPAAVARLVVVMTAIRQVFIIMTL